ncbi:MAG: phosphonate C-P lyase system protein PhnL [Hyphomicrobiaceae bacterium]|nr:phosphonate C-P lyase system protein PhnL [Hyphomicrobiaceae bacterium]
MSEQRDMLRAEGLAKTFTLHLKDGLRLAVLKDMSFAVKSDEAIALTGPSGSGKSTLMRMLYANYRCSTGALNVRHKGEWVNIAGASAQIVTAVRQETIGYVSQFLRVIPRVSTLQVVAEPLIERGACEQVAERRAGDLLERLNIPETLWGLSPVTFSGGEQQRVNIARGFAAPYPILLLDEPTASLDAKNRQVVIDMIVEARDAGTAVIGIFHDAQARDAVCTREIKLPERAAA